MGDDNSVYSGHDWDNCRWAHPDYPPLPDTPGGDYGCAISAAPTPPDSKWRFCDGSARLISYEIEAEIHAAMGNRRDGKVIDSERSVKKRNAFISSSTTIQ